MKKLLILLLILLPACTLPEKPSIYKMSDYQTQYKKELFDIGNRGLVMFEMKDDFGLNIYFKLSNSSHKNALSTMDFYLNSGAHKILMLPEGEYTLRDFYLYEVVYSTNYRIERRMDLKNTIKPIKFVVKSNEILYLGKLDIISKKIIEKNDEKKGFLSSLFSGSGPDRYKILYTITNNFDDKKEKS